MEYNLVTGKTNFILISLGVMAGLLVLIIIYYALTPSDLIKKQSTQNDVEVKNNNSKSSGLVGLPPSLLPQQRDAPLGFNKITGTPDSQVFNISQNTFTYDDAEGVCRAFGAELATYEQLVDSYKKGANWCNYGWSKGKLALYPTQYNTWLKMQDNDAERRNDCGLPGINGGHFDNPNLMFGVNCFGVKPSPRGAEKIKRSIVSDKEMRLARKVADIRKNLKNINILPFNESKWSSCKI